ncbi:MAG TPA: hypothetical protein VIH57_06100, partial [Bacteroidales bacterium]
MLTKFSQDCSGIRRNRNGLAFLCFRRPFLEVVSFITDGTLIHCDTNSAIPFWVEVGLEPTWLLVALPLSYID